MNNFKRTRNLLLLAGSLSIINAVFALASNQFNLLPIIAALCFFVAAHYYHKKIPKDLGNE